ncbi:hypothetical protein BCR35DRAFT_307911 [Leucosporidium creatinivorum]|uniref:Uncharacterized protein n=1 Tax=Leucosporidium creatinivorum TaxID=106004 RepID=A0A1Y2EGS8_9BASI|nr:hypothetical protein BCR35DRAFT_307911 [Leucosporidium creatinivorum]
MTLETRYTSGDPHPSSFPQRSSSFSRPSSAAPRYPSHARHQSHDSPFDLPSHPHQQALFPPSPSFGAPRLPAPGSRSQLPLRPDRVEFPPSPDLPSLRGPFPSLPSTAPPPRPPRLSLTSGGTPRPASRGRRPSLSGALPMGMIQGSAGMGSPGMGGGAVVRRSASARGLRG